MNYFTNTIIIVICITLGACGSTSSLRDAKGAAVTPSKKFTKVTVQDYTAKPRDLKFPGLPKTPQLKMPAVAGQVQSLPMAGKLPMADMLPGGVPATAEDVAKGLLPDTIAAKLQDSGFDVVSRNAKPDKDTLVIDGEVLRYSKGNGLLRSLVGYGVGGTRLDATTRFKDSNGKVLGEMVTHMKSLPLPGTVTGPVSYIGQSAKDFVNSAAGKIDEEAQVLAKNDQKRTRAEGAAAGLLIGAAAGAVIANQSGNGSKGALIGGAAGGAAGLALAESVVRKKAAIAEEQALINKRIKTAESVNRRAQAYNNRLANRVDTLQAEIERARTSVDSGKLEQTKKDVLALQSETTGEIKRVDEELVLQNADAQKTKSPALKTNVETLQSTKTALNRNHKKLFSLAKSIDA